MTYLSELIGRPVVDFDGLQLGVLQDLVANTIQEMSHPMIAAIVVKQKGSEPNVIPFSDVVALLAPAILLKCSTLKVHPYTPVEHDIHLVEDVMDKQIIDIDDVRVVRVNDIELVRINENVFASNVDVSTLGLLRRVGLSKFVQKTAHFFKREMSKNQISWDDVELLPSEHFMRLRVSADKLADLHPADLANIISDMNHAQSSRFLDTLSTEQLADALEEVEEDFQVSLVENMSDEKVADVLEEMSPDEAADLLAELPRERSEKLIELMEQDEAEDVRKLLAYPEDSAGGIMTTDYVTTPEGLSASEAIQMLRETAQDVEIINYVYVTDAANHLLGLYSLSDLVLSQPETPVSEIMHRRMASVGPLDSQTQVAQVVARYNLLAVPVVDEQGVLHGIVTADDALDKIIPTAWKKRLPRYYK
jgi:magnesium transporter